MRMYTDKFFSTVSVHFRWRLLALWFGINRKWSFARFARCTTTGGYTYLHVGPFKFTVCWPRRRAV